MKKVISVDAKQSNIDKIGILLMDEMPDVLFIHNVEWPPTFDLDELIKEQDMLWCLDGHKMEIRISVD